MHRRQTLTLLIFLLGAVALFGAQVSSPSGVLVIRFRLDTGGVPQWQVTRHGQVLLDWSPLGLSLRTSGPLTAGFRLVGTATRRHDETYTLLAGKTAIARDDHRELHVRLVGSAPPALQLELLFRAYDNGAAFRYVLPRQPGLSEVDIVQERTQFRFPHDLKAWAFQINTFHSSFEGQYLPTTLDAIPDTGSVYLPLTLQRSDGLTMAITEAALTDYGGMYLRGLPGPALEVLLPPRPDSSGAAVIGTPPFSSPWRILMVGARCGDLIESTIVQDLSPPPTLKDLSWIRPGKVIFPWWPNFFTGTPGVPDSLCFENQKVYIDFASANNIAYLELEPPWYGDEAGAINTPERYDITRPLPALRLPELFAYARQKHVGIFLWAHWQNVDRQADSAFAIYERWGAAGVKIDFMNRDDQEMVRWLQQTLQKAAAHHLMVYFHGAPKPTGMQRTFPHLLTQEGVLGNEQNKVISLITPTHTVTLPYTRMLAGPMDFTPGGFRNVTVREFMPDYNRPRVMGTRCHQLAMFVVYESPLMAVCDDPSAYRGQAGLTFIREVPTTWDRTRVIDGRIGEYIVMTRKRGQDWYLGAMTDSAARDLVIPAAFLERGVYDAELYKDGPDADRHPTDVAVVRRTVVPGDSLRVRLARGGGLAIRFTPHAAGH